MKRYDTVLLDKSPPLSDADSTSEIQKYVTRRAPACIKTVCASQAYHWFKAAKFKALGAK